MEIKIEIHLEEEDVKHSLGDGDYVWLKKPDNKSSTKVGVIIVDPITGYRYILFNIFSILLSDVCDPKSEKYHEIFVTDELPSSYHKVIEALDLKNVILSKFNIV